MRIHGSRTPFSLTLNFGLLGLALLGAMAAGCSSTAATVQQTVAAQPQGTVRLQEVADWEFVASHPSTIDIATLDSLLRGVMISDIHTNLSSLPVDGSKPMNVFSDEDVHYLAPLLAQALSQAQPEYVVDFRLSSSAGSGSEPTAGTLYVQNERLYLTVTEHNGTLTKVESSLFGSGRPARIVSMAPESAGQIEQAVPGVAMGRPALKSLSIDYKLFAKHPEPAPAATAPQLVQTAVPRMVVASVVEESPANSAPAAQPSVMEAPAATDAAADEERLSETVQALQTAREAMARKDAKISALRRDLESMRTQLETKDKELRAVKSTQQTRPKREPRNKAELTVR